ncbi:maltoporin LamB [Vibrio gigantis]|uniref:Maltoporin LamB n=1 Tax=Vibrio gigantis TaxID=296199 RepID=A0A5M9P576_9VIBR|nr:maltoporin LamB [Vibrio gigantis]KAA8681187.1 maltoporin LamB [Vibrio gigantis]ULN66757.1 maltoporin LamB [Vibrio gigantis]
MKKVSLIAAAVATTLAAGSAFAVDFNGYMRAGIGISGNGEGDVSFMKNGIGRLGNENDNYYEFGLSEELESGEQTWRVESMIAQGNDGAAGWEDGDFNVAQFAVKAKGVLAFDRDATLWAGKTYYQRKDIHITDFYFLNTSGTGGGIENISLGDQKLSVAVLQDGETADSTGYIADVRLANIKLAQDTSLEVALAYNFATEKDDKTQDADDGLMVTGILHQGLSNGFNQTILQYGTSGYGKQVAEFGSGAWYDRGTSTYNDASAFRVINWGVINLGEDWELGHQLSYHHGMDLVSGKGDSDLYTAVVRPMYKWDDTMRTVFEGGISAGEVDVPGATKVKQGGSKFTVAQAWAMGDSFWARPEIRVYGSYITDDEGTTFGDKGDSDFVVGIQAEAWW